jgi:hypothetical protein
MSGGVTLPPVALSSNAVRLCAARSWPAYRLFAGSGERG